jgi:hypothetical protein
MCNPMVDQQDEAIPYHVSRMMHGKVDYIFLVRGAAANGEGMYAYVSVPHAELQDFLADLRSDRVRLGTHNSPLMGGIGDPAPEVMEYMEAHYGFRHDLAQPVRSQE